MRTKGFVLLIIFYLCFIPIGFIPGIYKNDYLSFLTNQGFWCLFFLVSLTIDYTNIFQRMIIVRLILLSILEFGDDIYKINTPESEGSIRHLVIDFIVCLVITLQMLYSLWKKSSKIY